MRVGEDKLLEHLARSWVDATWASKREWTLDPPRPLHLSAQCAVMDPKRAEARQAGVKGVWGVREWV